MRVLLAIRQFDFGGAECHVRDLANALVGRGHDVWVVAPWGRQVRLLDPAVRHVPLVFSSVWHPLQAARLARMIARERIDVIHAHQRLATLTSILAGQFASRPVVATLHGQLQHDLTDWPGASTLLSRLIVISPFFADLVSRHEPALARKTVCIPNGVRVSRQMTLRDPSRLVVAFASRLTSPLNPLLHNLVNTVAGIAREFPALELRVFGDGPAHASLRGHASDVNVVAGRPVVHVAGYRDDLPAELARASLVLGVGRVAIEALAQGVPVLPVNRHYVGAPVSLDSFSCLAATNFVPQLAPAPTRATLGHAIPDALRRHDDLTSVTRAHLQPNIARDHDLENVVERVERVYGEVTHGRRTDR